MRNFEYFTPTRVIFGKDTHLKIGTVLKEQNCSKVLIHYGSHSAVSSGLIDEIRSSLDEAGISYVTLGGVVPNPRLSKVRALKNIGFVNFIFKGIRNPPVSNQVLVDFLNSV